MNQKIIISTNSSWNIINFRRGLLMYLQDSGFKIYVAAPKDDYSSQIEEMGCIFIPIRMTARSKNPLKDLITFLQYIKLFMQIRPSFFLGFTIKPNIWGGIAARIFGITRILNIAGLGHMFSSNGYLSNFIRFLYSFALKNAKTIFFQNKEDCENFISQGLATKENAKLLPGSGVNLKKFIFSPNHKTTTPFHFLFMGRLLYSKGIAEFIDASIRLSELYSEFECSIYGILQIPSDPDAVEEDYLNEIISRNSFIKFYGSTDQPEEAIRKSHCVVLPSYYNEGTPKILLEACSSGKPIITSDWKGCRDVVSIGKNGFLCDIKSSDSLYQQMKKMIDLDPETYEKYTFNARRMAEKSYNEEIIFKNYMTAINYESRE